MVFTASVSRGVSYHKAAAVSTSSAKKNITPRHATFHRHPIYISGHKRLSAKTSSPTLVNSQATRCILGNQPSSPSTITVRSKKPLTNLNTPLEALPGMLDDLVVALRILPQRLPQNPSTRPSSPSPSKLILRNPPIHAQWRPPLQNNAADKDKGLHE